MYTLKLLQKVTTTILAVAILIAATSSTVEAASTTDSSFSNADSIQTDIDTICEADDYRATIVNSALVQSIIHDAKKDVSDLKDAILEETEYTEGLVSRHIIDYVDCFKEALVQKYPQMSDLEIGKNILASLGDSCDMIETLPDDKIIEALEYTSVIRTESFYKETVDGERVEMSETEFYAELAEIDNAEQMTLATESVDDTSLTPAIVSYEAAYDQEETKNSYVKMTSTAYKKNPSYAVDGRNYFTIRGEVEWLKTPAFKKLDTLVIASSGNVDNNYTACAYAKWSNLFTTLYDSASIDNNGGCGDLYLGDALKIYNPSIYGVAVDVQVGFPVHEECLDYVYAYYGISTDRDVSCQVAYAHQTLGLGGPSVGIDGSGNISFSISIVESIDDYYGNTFTLYYENYSVLLTAPSNGVQLTVDSAPPTFKWSLQRGATEEFVLQIDYLGTGSYLSIPVNGGNSYTLTTAQWTKIINDSPFTNTIKSIRWRIKIAYTVYPNESYYSGWYSFTVTGVPLSSQETLPTISASNRYTERTINLGAGGYKDFIVSFATGGSKLIQTFGMTDTVVELYSASGSLLKSSDDEGYANNSLIRYYVTANIQYKIRIKFYSTSTYGNTKLAITPAYGALNSDATSLNKYEDIYSITDATGYRWSTYAMQNYTRVITFTAPSSGNYTFSTESDFDTYIYVIDPRSSTILTTSSYNDDGGTDNNALLTKYLVADVPYLIIYSAYNPSALTETLNMDLLISKN